MHLGIDFGTSYTKIGCYENDKFINLAGTEGKIPTVFTYVPANETLYFGQQALRIMEPDVITAKYFKLELKRNPGLTIGSYTLGDILKKFFSFLARQYIAPYGVKPSSVAVSVPNYFGLNARHLLLNAVEEVFQTNNVVLLPEPMAALIGYNTIYPKNLLEGEILSIDIGGGTTDFSFVSLAAATKEMIMETQFQIGNDAFSGAEIDRGILRTILHPLYQIETGNDLPAQIIKEKSLSPRERYTFNKIMQIAEQAKIELSRQGYSYLNIPDFYNGRSLITTIDQNQFKSHLKPVFTRFRTYFQESVKQRAKTLGLYSSNKWHIDYVLLLGGASLTPGVYEMIEELCPNIYIISPRDKDFNVVKGLCTWPDFADAKTSIKTIYPFQFYIEHLAADKKEITMEKIPFDTANLELDFQGRYKIFTVPTDSAYNISPDTDKVCLRVLEVEEAAQEVTVERFGGQELVFQLDTFKNSLPDNLDIYLDLKTMKLELNESNPDHNLKPESEYLFHELPAKQKDLLELIKNYRYLNKQLENDLIKHIQNTALNDERPYKNYAYTAFFKLLVMLQLLQGK